MSSFKGETIFASGPHVFAVGAVGSQAVLKTALGSSDPGHTVLGALDLTVTVTGRLTAADVPGLDDLIAAVEAQIDVPPKSGTLADNDGHTWDGMSFVTFTPRGPVRKGRVVSQAYEAVFIRLPA
jgi:hypothetical protein